MIHSHMFTRRRLTLGLSDAVVWAVLTVCVTAVAQNPQTQERLMAIHQAQITNKQKLAQYTWQETETISIKGDVKDTKVYQVQVVNGQQQKNLVNDEKAQSDGREGRLKERIVEKKTEEYE